MAQAAAMASAPVVAATAVGAYVGWKVLDSRYGITLSLGASAGAVVYSPQFACRYSLLVLACKSRRI